MYRKSANWGEYFSQHKEVSERERREGSATQFRHPTSTPDKVPLPADAVPITPNAELRVKGWSRKSRVMALDPVPNWKSGF
jgi:hypothetical protein